MYWYYFQSTRGIRCWWKEWVTRLQIIQFVIGLGFIYFASWTYFTSTYWPWLPNKGKCDGEEFAAFAGIGIITSYLFLFISFYLATYKKDGKPPTARKSLRRMSQAQVPDPHSLAGAILSNGHAKASGYNEKNGHATRSRKA